MSDCAHGPSILVVDDTIENVRLLVGVLEQHAYEIRPVTGGRQALQAAIEAPPDLVLLDVEMPDMSGFEVCTRLKSMPALSEVPVIFLTALTDPRDAVRAFELGGADYITKPFHVDEVLARVKVHLSLRQARRELSLQYDRLRALERLRDDLVKMVVHDMRTPLALLKSRLRSLDDVAGASLPAQASEDLRIALDASAELFRMTNDLLDVSRLEQNRLRLDLRSTDVVHLVREVCALLAPRDRVRTLILHAPSAPHVRCDATLVRRVVENLVGNALKYTPPGGTIRVDVAADAARLRVAVSDDGPGVKPELRARVFEKFAGEGDSAGLGLAFCRLAVEAHGGTIGVADAQPRGSVFWFELPL